MSAQQKSKKSTPAKKGKNISEVLNKEVIEETPKKTVVEVEVEKNGDVEVQQVEQSKKTKKSTAKKNQSEEQKQEEGQDFQETGTVRQETEKGQKKTKKSKDGNQAYSQPEDKDTNTESQTTGNQVSERKPKKSSSRRQVSQFRDGELTFEKLSLKDDATSATSTKSRHINGYQKYQSVMSDVNPNFGDRAKEWGKLSQEQKKHYNDTPLEVLKENQSKKKSGK